ELDPENTVRENLAEVKQEVMGNGKPLNVLGYLPDLLYKHNRAMTPDRAPAARAPTPRLRARLFRKPRNLLSLDEPTNDRDVDTLEL
ncbi:ABC transporter ATP-binding protein, partial [Salmonella enterica]